MSKYGEVARLAALKARNGQSPKDAWESSAAKIFPDKRASQEKGCPKCVFLGLAEEGLIKGIPPGSYTNSRDNKRYALAGISLLQENPAFSQEPEEMWRKIMGGEKKQHNEQMSVVAALWESGNIKGAA